MLIEDFKPEEVEWCDTCRPHVHGECDGCHKALEADEPQFRSQSHHFHPGTIEGIPGTLGINKVLCLDCYREDFAHVYPNEQVPV